MMMKKSSKLPLTYEIPKAANSASCPQATPQEEKDGEGGYKCEFVEVPLKQLQTKCSICLLVLCEPHLISCCGHSFCKVCIGRIQRDGKPCPLCNKLGFMIIANGGLKRALNELQVRCPHRKLGCEWVGELGKLDQHLNTDPQPERQLEGCPFTSIKCIHCKGIMKRHVIAGHQNERCPNRPCTCEYCEEYESTFEDVVNHWEECKCYLLPCPNNCHPSGSGIKQKNLEHHVKEECPMTVVECDFHYAGCGVKLPHKDMAGHMKEESVAHISLLAAENQRLAKQLLERDEKMQQLMQQNTELSNRIDQLERAIQEIQKELTQKSDVQINTHLTSTASADELKNKLTQTLQKQQKAHHKQARKVAALTYGLPQMEMLTPKTKIVPTDIEMAGFKELKDTNTEWYSTPFYTHMCGYKMCLRVDANGFGVGNGTHVSVFTCLMRGEFDSDLKWPFQGDITIQLLNQLEDKEHYRKIIVYTDTTLAHCASRVTFGERAMSWGIPLFIPHSSTRLNFNSVKNCQYLKDDCLLFRVLLKR